MYDAADRRFMAVDPVKGCVKEPATMVQYMYALDNPVKNIDPTGMWSVDCVVRFGDGTVNRQGTALAGNGDENVKVLQKALRYLWNSSWKYSSCYPGSADGGYGNQTLGGVQGFKRMRGIDVQPPSLVNRAVWLDLMDEVFAVWLNVRNWSGRPSGYFPRYGCSDYMATSNWVWFLQAGLIGLEHLNISNPTGVVSDYYSTRSSTNAAVRAFTDGNSTMNQASWDRLREELFFKAIEYTPPTTNTTPTNPGMGGGSSDGNSGGSGIIITYGGITVNSSDLPDPPVIHSDAANSQWTHKARAVARIIHRFFEDVFSPIQTYNQSDPQYLHPARAIDMFLRAGYNPSQANSRVIEVVEWIAENRATLSVRNIIYHDRRLYYYESYTPYSGWAGYYTDTDSARYDTNQHRDHVHLDIEQ